MHKQTIDLMICYNLTDYSIFYVVSVLQFKINVCKKITLSNVLAYTFFPEAAYIWETVKD